MTNDANVMLGGAREPSLRRLIEEDAVGQLRRCEGQMAALGSENGVPKLDWVEGVSRLLVDDTKLEEVEAEARAIWEQGIRHIIWAGMGGSVITVHVLSELGFCSGHDGERVAVYPLDSTDPAALNAIVRQVTKAKNLALPGAGELSDPALLRLILGDVMMIGVSMGMTSEEPITHLTWFSELIEYACLEAADHLLIMTLPGSYLDTFASEHQVPSLPLQLDGKTGTGGRMSAPTTRVFLLPAALYLTRLSSKPGQLRAVLQHGWDEYNLALATERPGEHPFVRLAAALSDASLDGVCRLLLEMPDGWKPVVPWVEQLMEESLGKEGRGVLVFEDQPLNSQSSYFRTSGTLHVRVAASTMQSKEERVFVLSQPYLEGNEPQKRLSTLVASFLGWQLSMALYGYLHNITFAGQPAVENYKARARILRNEADPLQSVLTGEVAVDGILTLAGVNTQSSPAIAFASELRQVLTTGGGQMRKGMMPRLDYLDLTVNGEFPLSWTPGINIYARRIANHLSGVPVKLRRAPAAYHSTEQSEMDGSPYFMSLRLLVRKHETSILGTYNDSFLLAQAVSTWQAMVEQGRSCCLLIIDGSADEAVVALDRFFHELAENLRYLD